MSSTFTNPITRPRLSVLPAKLPFKLMDEQTALKLIYKRGSSEIFRRVFMRRMLADGTYETSWQEIEAVRVLKWGSFSIGVDDKKLNFFDQSGIKISFDNADGFFSEKDYWRSFWYGDDNNTYLGRNRTLLRIDAGYLYRDCDGEELEIPEVPTVFYGIIDVPPATKFDNEVSFQARSLSAVMSQVNADRLDFSTLATNTADEFIKVARDYSDDNGIKVFQRVISETAWNIESTTTRYLFLTTNTSLKNMNVLEMAQKFAEAEGTIMYVDRAGDFNFETRKLTTTATRHYVGGARFLSGEGHTIISINSFGPSYSKVFNRMRIKFNSATTETSYTTVEEDWNWGDSSSSFLFGVKTYNINNLWLDSASSFTLANSLFNEYSFPRDEIDMSVLYDPLIQPLDLIEVSHNTQSDDQNLWDSSLWSQFRWEPSANDHLYFVQRPMSVLRVKHDIDKFTTSIYARDLT